ncbi:MAG: hypothetical protein Q8O75_00870 [bacterium]|nr:hypothetical protein [bacterium]
MHLFVLILHVVGAGIFVGAIAVAAYVTFRSPLYSTRIALLKPLQVIIPLATYAQLATGIYLFLINIDHFVYSEFFWLKMILYAADGLLATFILKKRVEADLAQGEGEIKNNLRNFYLLQLLIALLIISFAVTVGESH